MRVQRAAQAGVRTARGDWYGWCGADCGLAAKAGAVVGILWLGQEVLQNIIAARRKVALNFFSTVITGLSMQSNPVTF